MLGFLALVKTCVMRYWREVTIVILLIVATLQHETKPVELPAVTETKIQYVDRVKTETKTVYVDRIVKVKDQSKTTTTTKQPDGTIITQVVAANVDTSDESQEEGTVDEQEETHEQTSDKYSPTVDLSRYSADVSTNPKDWKDAKLGIGARISDLPVFGELEYEIKDKIARLGFRAEF